MSWRSREGSFQPKSEFWNQPVGDQEYATGSMTFPDEFGSFHRQQDTSCSASRKGYSGDLVAGYALKGKEPLE